MSSSTLRLSLCAVVMAGIAGCGGSSGPPACCPANPTTVTYTFTGATPNVVATQIGTRAYTQAALSSGTLTVSVPDGTTDYAVAYTCPSPNIIDGEVVLEASVLDGISFSRSCGSAVTFGTAAVQINAAAIPGASYVYVSALGPQQPWSGSTLTFSGTLPTGTRDVPIEVSDQFGQIVAARILRSQTVPGALNGGNMVVFQAGDETVSEPVTYSNVPSGFAVLETVGIYLTPGGAEILLTDNVPTEYPAMPQGSFQSGDYYQFDASAYSGATQGEGVAVENVTSSAGPVAFTFPAPWSYAGPTAAALPTFDFAYTGFSGMPNVSRISSLAWNLTTTSPDSITVETSANYQNGSTSLTIPDLSGLTGFIAPPASGTTVAWRASVNQGNPFLTTPPSGTELSVANSGTFTEP